VARTEGWAGIAFVVGGAWKRSRRTRRRSRRYAERVLLKILFALLGVQVLDLLLLIVLSRRFGFWQTVGTLFVVGVIGSSLARREGGRVWRGFQASLAEGRPPEHGAIDGMLVLLGGVLLLLPGILSDVVGLALFVPPQTPDARARASTPDRYGRAPLRHRSAREEPSVGLITERDRHDRGRESRLSRSDQIRKRCVRGHL
jgi:UPF0716 family protein affecting phage T7 exclusion